MRKIRHYLGGLLIAAMISVVAMPVTAFAAITDGRGPYGTCGEEMMRTYFANDCGDPYIDGNGDSGFVMPRRYISGILRPALYGIDTKIELYNYLVGGTGLGSGSQQARVGAAFIIHTMLGRSGDQANANGGKTISTADKNLLYDALVGNPDIVLTLGTYSNKYNSGSRLVSGAIDESFFQYGLVDGSIPFNVSSIILKKASTGATVYVLEIQCANPMGLGMKLDMPWETSSNLTISRVDSSGNVIAGPTSGNMTGSPGQIFSFRYTLRNDGPGNTTTTIPVQRTYTYPTSSQGWTTLSNYTVGRPPGYLTFNTQMGNTGVIPASAGGKSYCMQMRSYPHSMVDRTWLYTPTRCVNVPYNYNLTPTSAIAPGYPDVVPAGGSTKYEYKVTNSGPTYSEPMTYRILQFVMPPGTVLDDGGLPYRDGQTANCPAWASGVCATTLYASGSTTFIPTAPLTLPVPAGASDLTAAQTIGLAPGTRVCRLVALEKGSPTAVQRWSRPKCVTVGKKPFISIFNGDAWAGGNFMAIDNGSDGEPCSATGVQAGGFGGATTTYADGNDYGSFGEYQLFGIGSITSFGSGGRVLSAALPPGAATTMSYRATGLFYTPSVGPSTALTSHCLGDAMPYYATIPPAASLGATVDLASFPSSGVYKRTGDLAINAMTIPAGRHIVIIATGKVTINGNIVLANPGGAPYYTNLSDIPSFTLINSGTANTSYISVRQAVTQLDGVYQTYHNFVTCTESEVGPIGVDSGVCQQQLVVNGAVTANRFVLRRVKGGDPDLINRSQPAEIFNLRSDVFLSAYGSSQTGGQIRTVSEQELPPRY